LYVPEGSIRLFSPQVYFQEQRRGHAKIGATGLSWTLTDNTILRFPYAGGSNIPIMLTKKGSAPTVGLTYNDLRPLTDTVLVTTYLGVADEANQNLTLSQKELLRWHWRLGHINLQWVQMLTAKPRNATFDPIIQTKQPTVSSCALPM
jgi:hypothetical protein